MDDYERFCMKCGWNDSDFGCTSPSGEEVYQCQMYMYYHPEEVEKFEQAMEEWERMKGRDANEQEKSST